VTSPHVHVPYSPVLEDAYLPQVDDLIRVVTETATT